MGRMRKPARVVQLALCTKGQLHNCTNIAGTAFKSVLGWVGLGWAIMLAALLSINA